ncbi:NADP-dependent oxidoreductase [Burkholderia anthina]|uniref:NADP-dependent oxidoreductase n=1 Tax=Burkholderia anthina TaxID=179879 RepID=UPI00158E30F6|nr:NADP-dependent oxidoreductase [Burkholderia anthina]
MLAIGLSSYGGPEVLHRVELPDPHPARGQVRVKVRAAGVNPVDVMVRDGSLAGLFAGTQPPFVPGMDIAGTIDEIGEGVDLQPGVAVGQDVVGVVDNFGSYGGYSQYVCLPAASVAPVPIGATFPAAASFLMNALTARNALDTLRLPSGSTVLVTGAGGAVGAYAIALGNDDGLRMVSIASPQDEAFLRDTGTAEFIERGGDVVARVHRIFPAGVDAVVDAARLGKQIVPAIRDGGTIIALRSGSDDDFDRGVKSVFVTVRQRATDHAAIVRLAQQVADGLLPLRVAAVYPATDAAAAHRRFDQGSVRGRLILDFDDLGL